jgi:hypothetical protein
MMTTRLLRSSPAQRARALRTVLTKWPLVSGTMAEALTNVSRAAVQRSLAGKEDHCLIREVTGPERSGIGCGKEHTMAVSTQTGDNAVVFVKGLLLISI